MPDDEKRAISRRSVTGALALALLAPAGQALAATRILRGTVFYRERMALPPGAVLELRLLDVSRADAPSRTLAETRIVAPRNPAPFALRFDRGLLKPRRSYALQARIVDGEQLLFINTTRHSVTPRGPDRIDIRVERAMAPAPDEGAPVGRWLLEIVRGAGVIDRLQTVLEIAADGTVSGSGGCNRMSGRATIEGRQISFGPLASTNMACAPASMDQEHRFFTALGEVRRWEHNRRHGKLALLGAKGEPLMTFARM